MSRDGFKLFFSALRMQSHKKQVGTASEYCNIKKKKIKDGFENLKIFCASKNIKISFSYYTIVLTCFVFYCILTIYKTLLIVVAALLIDIFVLFTLFLPFPFSLNFK